MPVAEQNITRSRKKFRKLAFLLKRLWRIYDRWADKWLERAKEWQPFGF